MQVGCDLVSVLPLVAISFALGCGQCGASPPADEPEPQQRARASEVEGANPVPQTPFLEVRMPDLPDVDRNEQVFAKVGDSATVSRAFLECFSGDDVRLGSHEHLLSAIEHFNVRMAGGRTSFGRESLAADVGWSARQILVGNPSPLLQEVRAINPRFAFVLSGGNDVQGQEPRRYANRLVRIVDQLLVRGVMPILGSIMPRGDDPAAESWVGRYNAISLAVARGRNLPYIDFYSALSGLPNRGLARDGVHPNVFAHDNRAFPCDLTEQGLQFGNNQRNLLALSMLERLRAVRSGSLGADSAIDPEGIAPQGSGAADDPFVVTEFPFSHFGNTEADGNSVLDTYPGCDEGSNEGGPELIYRFELSRETSVRLWAYGPTGADVDVHLLEGTLSGEHCRHRDDEVVEQTLGPGTWFAVVDSFVSDEGTSEPGEYVVTISTSPPSP